MEEYYEILGAYKHYTDIQIKQAYEKLCEKYNPEKYVSTPLKQASQEKFQQIQTAYIAIMNQRDLEQSNEIKNNQVSIKQDFEQTEQEVINQNVEKNINNQEHITDEDISFESVEKIIKQKDFLKAKRFLDSFANEIRDHRWHFLKGRVYYNLGDFKKSKNHIYSACMQQPNNSNYNEILEKLRLKINEQRKLLNQKIKDFPKMSLDERFDLIESLIKDEEIEKANMLLDKINLQIRNHKWYFLKGYIIYQDNNLTKAKTFFEKAYFLDNNDKYKLIVEKVTRQWESKCNNISNKEIDFFDSVNIEKLINDKDYNVAKQCLLEMPEYDRNAKWHMLIGIVYFNTNQLYEANINLSLACKMAPYNQEYAKAYENLGNKENFNFSLNNIIKQDKPLTESVNLHRYNQHYGSNVIDNFLEKLFL